MKALGGVFSIMVAVMLLAGCASNGVFYPKVPTDAQAMLLDYYAQPDNKVFVLAVDPGGDFAYAYDHGRATLREAAQVAVESCDLQRKAQSISAKPYIYAINNKVVYREMIRKDYEANMQPDTSGQQAQIDEAQRQEETGEIAEVADSAVVVEPVAVEEAEAAFEEM